MYAIGGGEEAAQVAGINVKKYKILAFVLCAAMASGTGIVVASRVGSANTSAGAGYFLQSYAAAYIGCTVSKEGTPNVWVHLLGLQFSLSGKRTDYLADAVIYAEYYYRYHHCGCSNCSKIRQG